MRSALEAYTPKGFPTEHLEVQTDLTYTEKLLKGQGH